MGAALEDEAPGSEEGRLYVLCVRPWATPAGDDECDGFETWKDYYIGTNPNLACSTDNWPPDFNDDKTVNIIDVGAMRPVFNSQQGDGRYVARKDLNADGSINIIDIGAIRPFFAKSCT